MSRKTSQYMGRYETARTLEDWPNGRGQGERRHTKTFRLNDEEAKELDWYLGQKHLSLSAAMRELVFRAIAELRQEEVP
jgi:hypothetical protein